MKLANAVTDQMWWEGKNKSIPVVKRTIIRVNLILVSILNCSFLKLIYARKLNR